MENTYKWYIQEMSVIPNFNGITNFVTKIRWRYDALSDDGYTSNIEGQTTFNNVDNEFYTDYYNLTEDMVISWLNKSEDILLLQSKLDVMINEKRTPPIITLPIPWE